MREFFSKVPGADVGSGRDSKEVEEPWYDRSFEAWYHRRERLKAAKERRFWLGFFNGTYILGSIAAYLFVDQPFESNQEFELSKQILGAHRTEWEKEDGEVKDIINYYRPEPNFVIYDLEKAEVPPYEFEEMYPGSIIIVRNRPDDPLELVEHLREHPLSVDFNHHNERLIRRQERREIDAIIKIVERLGQLAKGGRITDYGGKLANFDEIVDQRIWEGNHHRLTHVLHHIVQSLVLVLADVGVIYLSGVNYRRIGGALRDQIKRVRVIRPKRKRKDGQDESEENFEPIYRVELDSDGEFANELKKDWKHGDNMSIEDLLRK